MADSLVPICTSRPKVNQASVVDISARQSDPTIIKSTGDVIEILKHEPDLKSFKSVVHYLHNSEDGGLGFKTPSASTTQIITLFVNDVIPNYWSQLIDDQSERRFVESICAILRSIPALGAAVARLKALLTGSDGQQTAGRSSYLERQTTCAIQLLELIVAENHFVSDIWDGVSQFDATETQRTLYWKEFVSIISSGRVISSVSQAEDNLKPAGTYKTRSWLGTGKEYAGWLAKNAATLVLHVQARDAQDASNCVLLVAKSLSLGYSEVFLTEYLRYLAAESDNPLENFNHVMKGLRSFEQRSVFLSLVRILTSSTAPVSIDGRTLQFSSEDKKVASLASFLQTVVTGSENLADNLVEILTRPESAASLSNLVLQAGIAALSLDRVRIDMILEKTFETFADEIFIKHAPIMQQESATQLLLLISGLMKQKNPSRLSTIAKTSKYIRSISDHLAANSTRVRWLGMIVGTGISGLVDKADLKMKFEDESLSTTEAKWYFHLTEAQLVPADTFDLDAFFQPTKLDSMGETLTLELRTTKAASTSAPKRRIDKSIAKGASGPKIVELLDDDNDLTPYGKPDSDPEDDDEDPTLVNRDKLKAPVYIRDLLVGLRETENYDLHKIALTNAARLIRQKSGFGKEVIDHIQELSSVLMNLNDTFNLEDFLELRQETLIAVLLANPGPMAQYYSKCALEGDFSLQQRSAILAAMGLAARELAGFKDTDRTQTPAFPSKKLPNHLHLMYAGDQTSLGRVSSQIQQKIVEPLALKAADDLIGPNALKVRTFSSRMEKEKTRKRPAANELAKVAADNFFFPLTGRYWTYMQAKGSKASFLSTHLLPVYLRTLALIMHTSGSWTISLPQMTSEFWTILLSIRSASLADNHYAVLEALLFALLVLFDVNENKERLAREHANELLESQEWARLVLNKIDEGDEEGNKIRGLAASVIVRCQEVVERWQRLMVGDLINY